MKKLAITFSVFLLLIFTMNTITPIAQQKSYSQGFYTMKDLNLFENRSYNVKNISPSVDGWLVIFDANKNVQQLNRIQASSMEYPLLPLRSDFVFVIYGNVNLVFS